MRIKRKESYHTNWLAVIDWIKEKPADVSMTQCFHPRKISLVWSDVNHSNLPKEISK